MSERAEPIRWGVLGCGDVVERKSGPALLQSDRSRIHAVVSSDGTSAETYAAEHDVPVATGDAERVISDPDVDAVYVATPPDTHRAYTTAAADAGKPILVEKPMARSAVEAASMIEACDRNDVELLVAYYRRFHPQVQRMRELMGAGTIGEPTRAFVNYALLPPADPGWRETPAVSGGGWFVDATAHRLDLLVSLLGRPSSVAGAVRSVGEEKTVEDIVSLTIEIDDVVCTVVSDFTDEPVDNFHVYGTAGSIAAETLDDGEFAYETEGESGVLAFDMPDAVHDGLVRHVEAVLLDGAANRSSGRDAFQTEALLDSGVRCAYADAIPVDVWDGDAADIDSYTRLDPS